MDGNGSYLYIKNWSKFQHYGHRSPPWIKLYRDLLQDYMFCKLPDSVKLDLVLIWLLAASHDGMVPSDRAFLKRALSLRRLPNTDMLINQGFLSKSASNVLAPEEKSREEKRRVETSKPVDNFQEKNPKPRKLDDYLYTTHQEALRRIKTPHA